MNASIFPMSLSETTSFAPSAAMSCAELGADASESLDRRRAISLGALPSAAVAATKAACAPAAAAFADPSVPDADERRSPRMDSLRRLGVIPLSAVTIAPERSISSASASYQGSGLNSGSGGP